MTVINAATIATAQVYTTPPLNLAAGCSLIDWARRSTDKNPINASERYRGIVINSAAITVPADACSSKFQRLLQSTITDMAAGMFQAWAKDNMSAVQYNGADINVDSALAFWAEKKQREVVDGAAILQWLESTATWAGLTEAQRAVWKIKLPKVAAPSYKGSFTKGEASKIAARIEDADAETPLGLFVMQRMANIMDEQSQEDAL